MINDLVKPFLCAVFCILSTSVGAQTYPTQPIKIVVGFSPGGVPDIAARVIGQHMSESWKQPVLVENKPGAGSNIAAQIVAGAPSDG